jgi:hypothetical protein
MVSIFEKYPGKVEQKAVFWIRKHLPESEVTMEADRVTGATIEGVEVAKRSLALRERSYSISRWALWVAVGSTVLAVIALYKVA